MIVNKRILGLLGDRGATPAVGRIGLGSSDIKGSLILTPQLNWVAVNGGVCLLK